VELSAPGYGDALEAELDLPRSEALALSPGDLVHLSPRRARVFPAREGDVDSLTSAGL
jgi:sulfate transport system ATP-binding protein